MTEKKNETFKIEDTLKNSAISIGIQCKEIEKAHYFIDKAVSSLLNETNEVQAKFETLREQNLWMKTVLQFIVENSSEESIRSKAAQTLRNCECQV